MASNAPADGQVPDATDACEKWVAIAAMVALCAGAGKLGVANAPALSLC
jgi:hypothetical protein